MKRLLAILLLVSVSCQFAAKMGIVVWYEANKDYVSDVLCINKDAPEKKCNGKCYLKKQLDKVENNANDDKETPVKKTENQLPEFVTSVFFVIHKQISLSTLTHTTTYTNLYNYQHSSSLFHPPPHSC